MPLLVAALACSQGLVAPASDVEEITRRHVAALSRAGCPGCPEAWTPEPCTFVEGLLKPGAGASAVLCASLTARGGERGLPDHVRPLAQQRLGEALSGLASANDALRLFAFGSDLERLGDVELWALGLEAQARALDALSERPATGAWPRALLNLALRAPPPTRIADALILEALEGDERVTVAELKQLEKASIYASNAAHTLGAERSEHLMGFVGSGPWPVDVAEVWLRAEEQVDRAVALAIDVSLREATSDGRRCPSLRGLVPGQLDEAPAGWTVDRDRCEARRDPTSSR